MTSEIQAPMIIAIDGPSASGKSTVAREVARRLGGVYVDSGALYRAVTWQALRQGLDPRDGAMLAAMLASTPWAFQVRNHAVEFSIAGVRPGLDLRGPQVREAVSDFAAVPEVREWVCARLREMERHAPLVMEGRDIGTVVFPHAPFKFFLDADPRERARRRARDLAEQEGQADVDEVHASLARRDTKDSTRRDAPLRIAPEAKVIDTTALSVEEVVSLIVDEVRRRARKP
jgi:cytidylate kinase